VAVLAALSVGRPHLDPTQPSTITYEVPDPGGRREAFDTGFDTLADHPFTGKGPGSYVSLNRGLPFRAHLTPLNVSATMGLPALAALVFLVVVLWRERRQPTSIATWSGLLGLAVDGLAQDIEHFRHVWVMIGLADADRKD
jgi:O-antigen ligase